MMSEADVKKFFLAKLPRTDLLLGDVLSSLNDPAAW